MNLADRACDLECVGKGKTGKTGGFGRHEFVGPVKIVLVESTPVDYQRKIWGSAAFTLAMLLMGATVFTVLFFTLSFKLPFSMNVHVVLCTLGLFMTSGILMFSTLFGGSMYLKPSGRKFQHFVLEVAGVLAGVVGTFFVLGSLRATFHAVSGFFATLLVILSSLIGPTVYLASPEKMFGQFNKRAHRYIAIPTFILCTTCFILGLTKESFIKWSPIKNLQFILIVFTLLYSVAALGSIYLRAKYGT